MSTMTIPLPPVARPLQPADVAYLEAVQDVMLDNPKTIKDWLSERCRECGVAGPYGNHPAVWDFWSRHFVLARKVIIGCRGGWIVDPNLVGFQSPQWVRPERDPATG